MRECRRIVLTIALCIVFNAFFNIAVFANEEIADEPMVESEMLSSMDLLDMESGDLLDYIDENESSDYVMGTSSIPELQAYRAQTLKDMGELELTTGFTRDRTTTFSDTKSVEGFGKEGVLVGMYVFHFEADLTSAGDSVDSIVVSQDKVTEIGASGIYSETIDFDFVGDNYVMLIAIDAETETEVVRLFNVCRKEVLTRDLLENVQINFFEEEEEIEIQKLVPKLTDFGF